MISTLASTRLDLSENLILLFYPGGLLLADRRPPHECGDAPFWSCHPFQYGDRFAVYCVIQALDDSKAAPVEVRSEHVHEAYGNRVLQARAHYGDGRVEDWTVRGEPVDVGFGWIRQPNRGQSRSAFRIWTPASTHGLQFWRTSEGEQTTIGWHPGSRGKARPPFWDGRTDGVMLYSEYPRAAIRFGADGIGPLRVALTEPSAEAPLPEIKGPSWVLDWEFEHGQLIQLSGNAGLGAAARGFQEDFQAGVCSASLDFGAHFDQVLLGGMAFLSSDEGLPQSCCLMDSEALRLPAALDEIALACESLAWCAPEWAATLLRKALVDSLEPTRDPHISKGLSLPQEVTPALMLLMAGRYLRLTGDLEFLCTHAERLRSGAESLLALRRPGEALPLFDLDTHPFKAPGPTAVVCAGLSRWAAVEGRLGNRELAAEYAEAAFGMQWAAIAPFEAGGLWNTNRSSFVSRQGEDPLVESDSPDSALGSELDFGQQVLAFWLGLCPDEEHIRRSYEWLDYTYTYATGRGGPVYPPGYRRTFHALLDVAVRMRHACGDVAPILQRIFDTGARAGLPFSRDVMGAALPAGMLLDNAPYFEIVLHHHYGLDYDAGGWRLATPKPIRNYPLTRVTNLKHKAAVFAVTWQGRGTIQRVTMNGAPLSSRVLDRTVGEHEVLVTLG